MPLKSRLIERSSPLPLYHQLKQILLGHIDDGTWRSGELIPAEQELQETYGLSRTTVRQALRELELEGRVVRHRGRGTFVSTPTVTHSAEPRHGLADELRSRGMTPGWTVLSSGDVAAPPGVAERLGVAAGASVYRLMRLRLANHEPIGVHVAHVAPPFVGVIDETRFAEAGSLDYLDARSLDGSLAERVLEAIAAGAEEAALLSVRAGAPMLRIRRRLATADGAPIEDLRATYRGDRFTYRVSSVTSLAP